MVAVNDLAAFEIGLRDYAPDNWQGKAQITFILQNAGAAARAKIILR